MAATTESVTAAKVPTSTPYVYGNWTSDSTKGNHVISVPFDVSIVVAVLDSAGTNPNILLRHIGAANSILITGSTGVVTKPADAAGILITNSGSGTTIDIDETSQVNSGTNEWIAFRK